MTSASPSGAGGEPPPPSVAGASAHALRRKIDEYQSNNSIEGVTSSISTMLAHAGVPTCDSGGGGNCNVPLSPPIELATTYERPSSGDYGGGSIYSRSCNPTRRMLEEAVGRLEMVPTMTNGMSTPSGSRDATIAPTFAFSSGMAAVASILLACKSPVKLLIPKDVYHGVPTQLHACLNDHGVAHESVNMTNCSEIRQKIEEFTQTSSDGSLVVWLETPSNPLCQVTDIRAACNIVHELSSQHDSMRILTVVDTTWAPPVITRPLTLGADAVLHSGTKYLGGHSDVLLGIASCSPLTENGRWLSERLKGVQTSVGAVASPLECWLTLRGLRTLHLRVERQCQTAMKLAEYLNAHKHVVKCHYPGLDCHPQHSVATKQMTTFFGGMLSFELSSESMAMAVAGAVSTIRRATSLGGTETLIEHRASIEPTERRTSPPGLLRLSVGLEDADDLIQDLETALRVASKVVLSN